MGEVERAPKPPYYYIHAEMQDASHGPDPSQEDLYDTPAAVTIELAMLLHRFEFSIGDEDRARLILFGGRLIQLDRRLHESSEIG